MAYPLLKPLEQPLQLFQPSPRQHVGCCARDGSEWVEAEGHGDVCDDEPGHEPVEVDGLLMLQQTLQVCVSDSQSACLCQCMPACQSCLPVLCTCIVCLSVCLPVCLSPPACLPVCLFLLHCVSVSSLPLSSSSHSPPSLGALFKRTSTQVQTLTNNPGEPSSVG